MFQGHEGLQYANHDEAQHLLGTRMYIGDREYRYVKAGSGAALVRGKLYQSKVVGANYDELAVAAAAVGATAITVTNGATTITANQFAQGYLNVEDDTGEAYAYKIKSHPAEAAGSAAFVVTLEDPNGIKVAFTSSTTVALIENPYDSIIIHPSPPTAAVVGVATHAVSASQFGWVQTKGLVSVLTDTTLVIGKMCIPSVNVDGAVGPPLLTEATPNTGGDQPTLGLVVSVSADTEYSAVLLNLP